MSNTTFKEIKCVQLNLHHSIAATKNIIQRAKDQEISIACVQELYQMRGVPVGIPAHAKFFFSGRDNLKAGVIIFNKDLCTMKVFTSRNVVAVTIQVQNRSVLVISAYCPPSEDLEDTLHEIENCLQFPHDGAIIASDLNAKSPVWGGNTQDERGSLLLEFTLSKGLTVINEENSPPTFDGSTGRSWIDTTIVNAFLLERISKWKVDAEPTGSDHNSISYSLYTGNPRKRKSNRYRLANLDPGELRIALSKDLANLKFSEHNNIDDQIAHFLETLNKACRKSRPMGKTVPKKNDWWSKHLILLRSKVRTAKRRLFKAKDARDIRYLRSKVAEALYRFSLNTAKREDWEDKCESVTVEDPFGVHFEVAKNPDARFFQLSTLKKADGNLTANINEAIRLLLNYHFPLDTGPDSPQQARIRQDSKSAPPFHQDPPFSIPEVDAAIKNIRSKKAPGPDGFYGDIIKEAYASNKQFIVDIFNFCLKTGYFPKRWKRAQVVMFVKPNKEDSDPSAYRPICLLDALGKALDKLITQRVLFHLHRTGFLHPNQYGFLPGRSAPEAILELKKWIQDAKKEEKHSIVISLDVKSAFSRVWWPMVLHILKKSKCPSNLFQLISSFLDDRSVFLEYDGHTTNHSFSIGCPQGSNSGPLYWILVADEALKIDFEPDVRLLAYADDFYLFIAATGKQHFQAKVTRAMEQLDQWSKKAKVSFAHEKTKLTPFAKKGRYKHPLYCSYAGNSFKLERNLRMLGVIIDDRLNGLPHIDFVGGRMLRILNRLTIAKHRRGLSGKVLKVLYKRALERILVYAAPAWWTGTASQKTRLLSIQRKVLLAVTGAFRTTSTVALQIASGIEPIDLVCDLESAWYHIKKSHVDLHLFGVEVEGTKMEKACTILSHPGSWKPVQWDKDIIASDLIVYTDGSKLEGQVGAAFCVMNEDIRQEHQYRLSDHCSVFQAEAVAIQNAIKWKKNNYPSAKCHIHTDSLSVLMALQNHNINHELIHWIRHHLDESIALHWVKAHIGIEGNETADRAAKAAATKSTVDTPLGTPQISVKRQLKDLLSAEWQRKWDRNGENGRFTHAIFPKVSRSRCLFNTYDIQAVSNHGLCPQYLRRFNLRSCSCRCGEDERDDIHHYIFTCPLLGHLRRRIKQGDDILRILSHPVLKEEMRMLLRTVYLNEPNIFQEH
ncbi:Putative protein in type-1 retrotransposable element R1DM [Araneus ventricosus]|uniref:Retrovirus-related Pol polyprotein from type-1 retrotransposable element R1 n=1 Tax=Araneus ventricosus TaxID=182803 RepID=A0A4Y2SVC4_ARAVE|nr:Putative protein in type-1 retrotransposable element R1DM [Araneus ventricosus]